MRSRQGSNAGRGENPRSAGKNGAGSPSAAALLRRTLRLGRRRNRGRRFGRGFLQRRERRVGRLSHRGRGRPALILDELAHPPVARPAQPAQRRGPRAARRIHPLRHAIGAARTIPAVAPSRLQLQLLAARDQPPDRALVLLQREPQNLLLRRARRSLKLAQRTPGGSRQFDGRAELAQHRQIRCKPHGLARPVAALLRGKQRIGRTQPSLGAEERRRFGQVARRRRPRQPVVRRLQRQQPCARRHVVGIEADHLAPRGGRARGIPDGIPDRRQTPPRRRGHRRGQQLGLARGAPSVPNRRPHCRVKRPQRFHRSQPHARIPAVHGCHDRVGILHAALLGQLAQRLGLLQRVGDTHKCPQFLGIPESGACARGVDRLPDLRSRRHPGQRLDPLEGHFAHGRGRRLVAGQGGERGLVERAKGPAQRQLRDDRAIVVGRVALGSALARQRQVLGLQQAHAFEQAAYALGLGPVPAGRMVGKIAAQTVEPGRFRLGIGQIVLVLHDRSARFVVGVAREDVSHAGAVLRRECRGDLQRAQASAGFRGEPAARVLVQERLPCELRAGLPGLREPELLEHAARDVRVVADRELVQELPVGEDGVRGAGAAQLRAGKLLADLDALEVVFGEGHRRAQPGGLGVGPGVRVRRGSRRARRGAGGEQHGGGGAAHREQRSTSGKDEGRRMKNEE